MRHKNLIPCRALCAALELAAATAGIRAGIVDAQTTPRAACRSFKSDRLLAREGAEVTGSSPEEFGVFFKNEIEKWAKVIKAAGIRLE